MLPLVFQACVVPAALAAALLYPATNKPALLIALDGRPPAAAIAWGSHNDAPLIGLTAGGDAAVLRLSSATSVLAALRSGFLPIAADGGLCGDPPDRGRAPPQGTSE
jgi:hypothetical protein